MNIFIRKYPVATSSQLKDAITTNTAEQILSGASCNLKELFQIIYITDYTEKEPVTYTIELPIADEEESQAIDQQEQIINMLTISKMLAFILKKFTAQNLPKGEYYYEIVDADTFPPYNPSEQLMSLPQEEYSIVIRQWTNIVSMFTGMNTAQLAAHLHIPYSSFLKWKGGHYGCQQSCAIYIVNECYKLAIRHMADFLKS